MTLDPIETLAQLVGVPSVNPMGRPAAGPPFGEDRLTEHLEKTLRRLGLVVQRQLVTPGRENVVARLEGDVPPQRGGKLILLDAHQDTVPVDGMTIDPFAAEVRGRRLYGRGACDTKGGMAAMLVAVGRLAEQRRGGLPTIVISCTINEEYGFDGASALTRLWTDHNDGIIPRRPDAAVVAEPTDLNVVVAHKGMVRWKCHTSGRAVHSAQPEAGDNAVYKMAHSLTVIERYAREVVGEGRRHPLCGSATLSVGTIRGGVSVNTVPDRCTIEIDRRLPPGEDPEQARRDLIDYLARADGLPASLEHDPTFMQGPALSDDANGPLADHLWASVDEVLSGRRQIGAAYGTNAAFFSAAGVPSVVFGPGSIEQAHTRDEWISIDQLEQAAEILYRFIRSY